MARESIHLTLQVIIEAIEDVLITYPYYFYQQVFAISGLRRKLIVYVLSQIRSLYTVIIEDTQKSSSNQKFISKKVEINGKPYLLEMPVQHLTQMSRGWPSIYVRPLISSEQQLQIENFIQQGIFYILQENSDCSSHRESQLTFYKVNKNTDFSEENSDNNVCDTYKI